MREHILMVEDNPESGRVLKEWFEGRGFVVLAARSENEFWRQISRERIDLVLFNICLKNRMGSNVYHALLNFKEDKKIPVVFETQVAEDSDACPVIYDENYVFFPKSVSFKRLYAEIQKLLSQRHAYAA